MNFVAFHAVKTDRVLGHKSANILGVAVLFDNIAQVFVRKDAAIRSIRDTRGKRVSLGQAGSAGEFAGAILLSYFDLDPADLQIQYLDNDESISRLVDGSLDAFIDWRAIPAPGADKALGTGKVELLSIGPELLSGLRRNHPFLRPFTIPAHVYPRQDQPISTIATKQLLVASPLVPASVIHDILRRLASHIADLIAHHPAAAEIDLSKEPSLSDGMVIDLHPGALQFYRSNAVPSGK